MLSIEIFLLAPKCLCAETVVQISLKPELSVSTRILYKRSCDFIRI